jgi:hypothetical protein
LAYKPGSLEVIQVNLVVFLVSAYELYINRPYAKYNSDYQAVLIPFNIEHVEIVTHRIDVTEHLSQFVEICPIALFRNGVPIIQLILNGFMFTGKLSYRPVADYDHD